MDKIHVTANSSGQQPDWVKQGWIGEDLAAKKAVRDKERGYNVLLAHGLSVIRQRKPDVAAWWDGWAFNQAHRTIFFSEKVCKLVVDESQQGQVPQHNGHGAEGAPKSRTSRGAWHKRT